MKFYTGDSEVCLALEIDFIAEKFEKWRVLAYTLLIQGKVVRYFTPQLFINCIVRILALMVC